MPEPRPFLSGNYRHTTSCDKASECVFFVESDGAFDLHLVTGN